MSAVEVGRLVRTLAACRSGEARRLRLAALLTLDDVARPCGVVRSSVSRWERGEQLPRGEQARLYGLMLDSIRDALAEAALAERRRRRAPA